MSVRRYFFLFLPLAAMPMLASPVLGQSEARIQIAHPGVDLLKEDFKYLLNLAPDPLLQKQWKTLDELIDSFAQGVDPTKPMRVDFVIGKEVNQEIHVPVLGKVDGKNSLIDNIKGLGFREVKPVAGSQGLWSIHRDRKSPPEYFLRVNNKYASIAKTQAVVPANLPDPIKGVQPLLDLKHDITGSMTNGNDAGDLAARRKNFAEVRKQLEGGLAFKRNEDKNDFALRKLSLQQNLNEIERFVVEIESLQFFWNTDIGGGGKAGKGQGGFSLTALPNTDLFKSVEILAAKPSYFANVPLGANSVISGKVNFALDDLRVGHLKDFYTTVRPVIDLQIEKRAALDTRARKDAAKKSNAILLEMLADGAGKLKAADTFLDLRPVAGGGHTLICGIRSADGTKSDAILELVNTIEPEREVKSVEKIGDVSVHSISLPPRKLEAFQKLFPGEKVLYIATSKDAVWGAAGANVLAELKTAIEQAGQPAPADIDPRIFYYSAHAARLTELLDIFRPQAQKPDENLTKDEVKRIQQREKELDQIRKLANDAQKNCDSIFTGEVKRNGKAIEGTIDVAECVLKFVGSVIANFVKNME